MPTIEVSDQTFQLLQQMAQVTQQTPDDLISSLLPRPRREYTQEEIEAADYELFSHVVHAPYAVGADNESIDADLIAAYDNKPIPSVECRHNHAA